MKIHPLAVQLSVIHVWPGCLAAAESTHVDPRRENASNIRRRYHISHPRAVPNVCAKFRTVDPCASGIRAEMIDRLSLDGTQHIVSALFENYLTNPGVCTSDCACAHTSIAADGRQRVVVGRRASIPDRLLFLRASVAFSFQFL